MNVIVKLTVSNLVYRFYRDASLNVADSSPEQIMSDALSAYAAVLSEPIAKVWEKEHPAADSTAPRPCIERLPDAT